LIRISALGLIVVFGEIVRELPQLPPTSLSHHCHFKTVNKIEKIKKLIRKEELKKPVINTNFR